MESITALLSATRDGDTQATEKLFAAVYSQLRVIARSQRHRWVGNYTINTTALIHEAYLRLAGSDSLDFQNRTHFFATAAKAMRQILVNYAEQQCAAKRGGNAVQVPLEEAEIVTAASAEELLDVERVLKRLEAENPRRCQIVECRIFAGMTVEETAEALAISPATVKREWQVASAVLYRDLQGAPGREP
jgi:RNA polymerase sigma factor (TIGR02999 family)